MNKTLAFIMALLGMGCSACSQAYETVSPKEFETLIAQEDVQLLDVRTPEEFAEGHISGAVNINVQGDDFMALAQKELKTDKRVAVYCRSGKRASKAAEMLAEAGYQVTNLAGGILAWKLMGKDVTTETEEVDEFVTKSGKKLRFHALVHASIRIEFEGQEILIDPVRKLGNRTIDYTKMPDADFIFITHEHGDHFDKEAIQQLTKSSTKIIANPRCAEMLGLDTSMKNGEKLLIADSFVAAEAVPAYNITEGHTLFHPKGRDNGYILILDGLRIYIAGDTEDIPEMANIKDIDIAFLPCNQPYTMTPEQLIRAARVIKPKVLFPYHYGQTDLSSVPEQLKADGIDVRIRHYE